MFLIVALPVEARSIWAILCPICLQRSLLSVFTGSGGRSAIAFSRGFRRSMVLLRRTSYSCSTTFIVRTRLGRTALCISCSATCWHYWTSISIHRLSVREQIPDDSVLVSPNCSRILGGDEYWRSMIGLRLNSSPAMSVGGGLASGLDSSSESWMILRHPIFAGH